MMKKELMTALTVMAEKLKNNTSDDCSLHHVRCRMQSEVKTLAALWTLPEDEALVLSAVIVRVTDRLLDSCTFSDIATTLGVSNLELMFNFHLLRNLEERGLVRTEEIDVERLPVKRFGASTKAIMPSIPELARRYLLGEKVAASIIN